jgi:sulfite exporter TauE/SafE
MCGIFVLSCSGETNGLDGKPRPAPHRLERHLAFHLGRLVALSALGALAGAIGSLAGFAAHYARTQAIVSIAAGVVMALLALGYVGLIPKFKIPEVDVMGAGGGWGRRIFIRTLRSRAVFRPLFLGALVGFLPCMLTYTVLIPAAATLSAEKGLLVMLFFGLGTVPGLLTLGLLSNLASNLFKGNRFRIAMTRVSAVVMLLMAVVFICRGVPYL